MSNLKEMFVLLLLVLHTPGNVLLSIGKYVHIPWIEVCYYYNSPIAIGCMFTVSMYSRRGNPISPLLSMLWAMACFSMVYITLVESCFFFLFFFFIEVCMNNTIIIFAVINNNDYYCCGCRCMTLFSAADIMYYRIHVTQLYVSTLGGNYQLKYHIIKMSV